MTLPVDIPVLAIMVISMHNLGQLSGQDERDFRQRWLCDRPVRGGKGQAGKPLRTIWEWIGPTRPMRNWRPCQ
jgi:hypothetical protein